MQRLVNSLASFLILLGMLFLCGCETSKPARPLQRAAPSPEMKTVEARVPYAKAVPQNHGGAYPRVVMEAYYRAWKPPGSRPSREHAATVSVTILRDGRVISARIVRSSGDVWMDKSVRDALDKVRVVAPFENGAKEKSRTFVINFDSKTVDG